MNLRQKKKLFKKNWKMNPPSTLRYTDLTYHVATKQIWGGEIRDETGRIIVPERAYEKKTKETS